MRCKPLMYNYTITNGKRSHTRRLISAEIERKLISQRAKEALARKKAEGIQLGRPIGKLSMQNTSKLYPKERQIRKLRNEGVSFAQISKILKVNRDTVRRYYHTFMENE